MQMAAGRQGFGDRERSRKEWDRRAEGIGRKTRSCCEGERYVRGVFGGGEKIRVRVEEKEKELGELSSGSECESPREFVVDGVLGSANGGATSNSKRASSHVASEWENRKKARMGCSWSRDTAVSHSVFFSSEDVDVHHKPESKSIGFKDRCYDAGNGSESGRIDEQEDEVVITRNVLSSRWANDGDAYEDDVVGGISHEGVGRKKGAPSLGGSMKLPTSIDGETSGDSSDGTSSKLSQSGSEHDIEKPEKGRGPGYVESNSGDGDPDSSHHDSEVDDVPEGIIVTPIPVCPRGRSIDMLQGCRSVNSFEWLNKISEGTYGVVYRARDKKTGEILALKQVKMEKEREGFPLTALREINILLSLYHPSIIDVKEVVVGDSPDKIFMVMEYMDHDLKVLMESMKQPFSQNEVKCLMLQLLEGVHYLHDNWVLHRDLKTSNLLINNSGELKICDFGLSRQYGSSLKPYTPLVVTLWYRAPELLLGTKQYSTAVDMWSLGCIMAELLSKEPLFNGKTNFDQLDKIFRILGTPNEKIWPGFAKLPDAKVSFVKQPYNRLREKFPRTSFTGCPTLCERGFDLLNRLLTYDPDKRITAEDALQHEWFKEVSLPKSKDFMPTFPARHAQALAKDLKESGQLNELRRNMLMSAPEINNPFLLSLLIETAQIVSGVCSLLSHGRSYLAGC